MKIILRSKPCFSGMVVLFLMASLLTLFLPSQHGKLQAQTGDFLVSNYATDFELQNYLWRGYVFRPSREVEVTHMWGGCGTNCIAGFNGAIFEASWTGAPGTSSFNIGNMLRQVQFTPADISEPPVEMVELSQPITLSPDNFYLIAQGRVQSGSGCHYSTNSIDIENLLLGSAIIGEWYPDVDIAYQPGGSGTGAHLENTTLSHTSTTPIRVLVGFRYLSEVVLPGVETVGAEHQGSGDVNMEGLLLSSGADLPEDETALYFEYGTHPNLVGATITPADPSSVEGPAENVTFTLQVSDLAIGETYYYRAFAINEAGRSNGQILSFATIQDPPVVETAEPQDVEATSATLGGLVLDDAGLDIQARGVYYGTSPDPVSDGVQVPIGSGTGAFSTTVENLEPNTQHYVVAYASSQGGVGYGEVLPFTTLVAPPSVITLPAGDVTPYTAVLGGEVTDDGGSFVSERGVWLGTDPDPLVNGEQVPMGSGMGLFDALVGDLSPNTVYYFVAYATNEAASETGEVESFSTPGVPPEVETLPAAEISSTEATLEGEVLSDGGLEVWERGFYFGNMPDPVATGGQIVSGEGVGFFDFQLTALVPNTSYHFVAYSLNDAGEAQGEELSFTTLAEPPSVETSYPEDVSTNSALLGGVVTYDGGAEIISRGVLWGQDPNLSMTGTEVEVGGGLGPFWTDVDGLLPDNTYYVMAFAENIQERAYGEVIPFVTDPFLIKVPSAFYPESTIPDNRVFRPIFAASPLQYRMRVFNNWGALLYESDMAHIGWDGRTGGVEANAGGYVYHIEYTDLEGQEHSINGQVILVR